MDYRYEIAQLLNLNTQTTKKLLKDALKHPVLGEAIALAKNVGFNEESNDSWGVVYFHVKQILHDKKTFKNNSIMRELAKGSETVAYKTMRARMDTYRVLNLPSSNKYLIEPVFWQTLAIDDNMANVAMELEELDELMLRQQISPELIETYEGTYYEFLIPAYIIDYIVEMNANKLDIVAYRQRVTMLQNAMTLELSYALS